MPKPLKNKSFKGSKKFQRTISVPQDKGEILGLMFTFKEKGFL